MLAIGTVNCHLLSHLLFVSRHFAVVQALLFLLEEVEETICPLANGSDVETDVLWRGSTLSRTEEIIA